MADDVDRCADRGVGGDRQGRQVVGVDILARTAASPVEIPIGLLTAIIGAPVFVWFVMRVGRSRT